jgi:hypothetical protein
MGSGGLLTVYIGCISFHEDLSPSYIIISVRERTVRDHVRRTVIVRVTILVVKLMINIVNRSRTNRFCLKAW